MNTVYLSIQIYVLSSVLFIKIIQLSEYRSLTSLIKFISRHFILFLCDFKENCFLSFSFDGPLLVYQSTDFRILIIYSAYVLNSLTVLMFFWWRFQSFVYCFPDGAVVKNSSAMVETQVRSLSQENPLEKEMTIHSSTLAWRIPWTEDPGGLQSMGSQELDQIRSDQSLSHVRLFATP